MDSSLGISDNYKSRSSLFVVPLFLMAILLQQSNIMFGVNISFADIFCLLIFLILASKNQLSIPITSIVFFMLVSIFVLGTAVYFVPLKFMYYPVPTKIISEFIKLLAIFLYLIVGYNLSSAGRMESVIKWYSISGLIIGAIGIFLTVFHIRIFSSILFYADIRFRGLMNDPNYFSILQISALVYFSRIKTIKSRYKYLAYFITLLSVVVSGSKTGIITLICYLFYRLVEYWVLSRKKVIAIAVQFFIFLLILLITPIVFNLLQALFYDISNSVVAFARIQYLFTDFSSAISHNGSGRDITWKAAAELIQSSPLIGIGIGTYMNIVSENFQSTDIAHNTFLQIAAEWGIPLAFILFFFIFYLLGRTMNTKVFKGDMNLIFRDIIIILLIGSMAISLNNSRLLWLILGGLISSIYCRRRILRERREYS